MSTDLLSRIPLTTFDNATAGNTGWGWTDPDTGREYAIMGTNRGTAFVDITVPTAPVYLGQVRAHLNQNSSWREFKVAGNHVYIVSEATNHGMQVFDLTRLRGLTGPPVNFTPDAHYNRVGRAHNVAVNAETGFAYIVGARSVSGQSYTTCNSGLHMVDISNPATPTFAGCFSQDGYTHDVQCIVYDGPDSRYTGREICWAYNEDTVTIVDVTNKSAPVMLSQGIYPNTRYTHQGWLTEDRRYVLVNDELDTSARTRTIVMNVADLQAPTYHGDHFGRTPSSAHNLYIDGRYAYLANYRSGLSVLDLEGIDDMNLVEVAYFDTYPANDNRGADNGAWNVYPFFRSGTVVVSDINRGLFMLRVNLPGTVGADAPALPGGYELSSVYPNPFRDRAQLSLHVAETQHVRAEAFDMMGRRVATLLDGTIAAGSRQSLTLDSEGLAAGSYMIRVQGDRFKETRRVTLVR
jgi:choice-of-anchor B domain-containing protein